MRGLDIRGVVEFISELELRTGYPVPAPRGFASQWSRGLGLERRGTGRLLFTGALYQLVPYIEAFIAMTLRLEAAGKGWVLRYGGLLAKSIGPALSAIARPDPEAVRRYNNVVRSAASLLIRSGVEFDYVPEVSDMYSGALLYDLGALEALKVHGNRLREALESMGAMEVITIDPHSAETLTALRDLVGLKVEVIPYLELLKPSALADAKGLEVTVHDSCIYARRLGLSGRVRELLRAAGLRIREPPRSGASTGCCGGPVEALSPGMATSIARARAEELASVSGTAVAMCPICLANLSRARVKGLRLVDISEALSGSL